MLQECLQEILIWEPVVHECTIKLTQLTYEKCVGYAVTSYV